MEKIKQLEGYVIAGIAGSAAILLGVVGIWQHSTEDAIPIMAGWLMTLLAVLAISELATSCRLGWAIGTFLNDLRGEEPEEEYEDEAPVETVAPEPVCAESEIEADEMHTSSLVDRAKLETAIMAIVQRFHEGKSTGRASCVNDGACDQRHWNLANALLQALGLRRPGSSEFFSTGNLDVDLGVAMHGWILRDHGRELVVTQDGRYDRLDLVASNYIQQKEKTGA